MSFPVPANIVSDLRRYAAPFALHPPILISRFQGGSDPLFPFDIASDKGLGILLLCAALYRPGAETRATSVITGLYTRLGNGIFRLNRTPFETLQKTLTDLPIAPDPEEQKRIPGILRSVCDFFYETGSLKSWLASTENWETCVQQLSTSIYWMGKHSPWKTKSRHFLWLTSYQPEFARYFPQSKDFCWPVGEGHGRFLRNILWPTVKLGRDVTPEKRLRFFAELSQEVFPSESWKLFQVLDAYLRPEKEHEYLCRKFHGGCEPCPLLKRCPAAKYFGKPRR